LQLLDLFLRNVEVVRRQDGEIGKLAWEKTALLFALVAEPAVALLIETKCFPGATSSFHPDNRGSRSRSDYQVKFFTVR
jgi:hypothetical protein